MWIARLNTGEIVKEPPTEQQGELSAWHLLIARCRADNVRIVDLQVVVGSTCIVGVHKADGYAALYQFSATKKHGSAGLQQGLASIVGQQVFINWLDEHGIVTQEVRALDRTIQHTTQK